MKKDYKSAVLNYLKENANNTIPRGEIIAHTGISKSRLSEVLNSLKNDGFQITTPPRSGMIILETTEDEKIIPEIKDSDLRQWIILFLLSRYGALTFRELIIRTLQVKDYEFFASDYLLNSPSLAAYDDNHLIKSLRSNVLSGSESNETSVAKELISITSMRRDLTILREQGLVDVKQETQTEYVLTNSAPYILTISEDTLFDFCQKHEATQSTTSELIPVKNAYKKIKNIISYEQYDLKQRLFGKINQISKKQMKKLNEFINHPYNTNLLQLNTSHNGVDRHNTFATGLIFYSVETSAFYALGYSYSHARTEAIKIEWLSSITDLPEKNTLFHSEEYYDKYEDMFSAGYDDTAYKVKVLFQDFGNVYTRFYNLSKVRKNSNITKITNPPADCIYSYIYTDTVRGLSDFARFLRGFGYSTLAIEPPALRQMMINTYTRSLSFYEKDVNRNE